MKDFEPKELYFDKDGVNKKEDLDGKINEIKIYLKTQFEIDTEKKDSKTIDKSIKNKSIFKSDKDLTSCNKGLMDIKREMNQAKKENNYSLVRSKSNCEGKIELYLLTLINF